MEVSDRFSTGSDTNRRVGVSRQPKDPSSSPRLVPAGQHIIGAAHFNRGGDQRQEGEAPVAEERDLPAAAGADPGCDRIADKSGLRGCSRSCLAPPLVVRRRRRRLAYF